MEHRYMSLNTYLSLQPFWDITQDQTSIRILYDDAGQKIGEIFRFSTNQETLETIPGIGMAALVLSCSPELPVAFACGPLSARRDIPLLGVHKGVYCRFFAGAFTRIFGIPSQELANMEIPLSDLIPSRDFLARFLEAEHYGQQCQMILDLCRAYTTVSGRPASEQVAQYVVTEILSRSGDVRVKELSQQTGYSARHLQTICNRQIGLTPKQFAFNVRLQNLLKTFLYNPMISMEELACTSGYYDPSHISYACKRGLNMSAAQLLHNPAIQRRCGRTSLRIQN